MFIRKKFNKSGSISIQVLEKREGKNVLVRTIGSSKSEVEVSRLVQQGNAYIKDAQGQLAMDLSSPDEDSWFDNTLDQIKGIQLIGPELLLGALFDEIGFNAVPDELFRHLVISRITSPSSKLKTVRYLQQYKNLDYNVQEVYRYLDKLVVHQKEMVERISYQHTLKILGGTMSVVFYDVTTIYFEAEKEDDLRVAGFSKDGKHSHPQIILGLLVSVDGYPLAYDIFKGNSYEGHTMLPVIDTFKEKYGLSNLIIIADAGLLTNKNIEELIEKQYEFILGARIKAESKVVKNQILNLRLRNGESEVIDKGNDLKLIVNHSDKRAKKDKANRERGLKKLEKTLSKGKLTKKNINNRGYNKYLKMEGDIDIRIDYFKFNEDARWDGLKGYVTNTSLQPRDLMLNYNELWKIEKAFRVSKTDLRVRPIYHRLERRIAAHICISFVSYKIYKELERQLKIREAPFSAERAIEIMKTIYGLTLQNPHNKKTKNMIFAQKENQRKLLELFKINLG